MTARTLVVGAADGVGAMVAERLLAQGRRVRALTRNPAGKSPAADGIEWVACDLATGQVPDEVFEGVHAAFLLAPNEAGDAFAVLKALIEAARKAGTSRIVMMTALGPDDGASRSFRLAEAELAMSAIPHAVLRPNWFMQSFSRYWAEEIKHTGKLRVPAANARVAFVDARDIADCAVELLGRSGESGTTYTITGDEALSMADVMKRISGATGRALKYEPVEEDVFRQALTQEGVYEELTETLVTLFREIRNGQTATVTDDVASILERPPRRFADFAAEHRADWMAE